MKVLSRIRILDEEHLCYLMIWFGLTAICLFIPQVSLVAFFGGFVYLAAIKYQNKYVSGISIVALFAATVFVLVTNPLTGLWAFYGLAVAMLLGYLIVNVTALMSHNVSGERVIL